MPDHVVLTEYRRIALRLRRLTETADLPANVPACPNWDVQQLIAHLVGVAEDWVDGNLAGYGSEPWAQAQVDRSAGLPLDTLFERWLAAIDRFAALDDVPGMGDPALFAFGDAVVHEADLRAVIAPGTVVPDFPLGIAVSTGFGMWRRVLNAADAPPLRIELETDDTLGFRCDPEDESDDADDVTSLAITRNELFRMLMARRSVAQIREYEWSGDPEPFLAAGLAGPNIPAGRTGIDSWPTDDLVEI